MSAVSAMLVLSFPVGERRRESVVDRRGRSPSGGPLDLGRIAVDASLLGLAQPRGVRVDPYVDACERDKPLQQRTDAALDTRAYVVGFARFSALEQREVGCDHVIDRREIARD